MMVEKKHFAPIAGLGCPAVFLLAIVVIVPLFLFPIQARRMVGQKPAPTATSIPGLGATREVIPTLTLPPTRPEYESIAPDASFTALYELLDPGVDNIRVYVERGGLSGSGAGSGFMKSSARKPRRLRRGGRAACLRRTASLASVDR
jgi:hypothetical protein